MKPQQQQLTDYLMTDPFCYYHKYLTEVMTTSSKVKYTPDAKLSMMRLTNQKREI